jgi:TolB protein
MKNRMLFLFLAGTLAAIFFTARLPLYSAPSAPPPSFSDRLNQPPHMPPAFPSEATIQSPEISRSPQAPEAYTPWSHIVFQSRRDGNWEIYLMRNSIHDQVRLTSHTASDIHPRLNRGATRIAFASNRTGSFQIFTMNLDGGGLIQLTDTGASDNVNPIWSPDGTKIAFESYRDGQAEIYVMNADGSGQTRLTYSLGLDAMPTWSPDGSKIAFVSTRSGGYRIWAMNANGSNPTKLSSQPSLYPAWSPDGSKIAYSADGNGNGWLDIWTMNADGSDQQPVALPSANNTHSDAYVRSWSPDGRYIAFTHVYFIYVNQVWYWTHAYLQAYDTVAGIYPQIGSNQMDWDPDWQTTDAVPPMSRVQDLPTYSRAGGFGVAWTGSDDKSGIAHFGVQSRIEPEIGWTDWHTATLRQNAVFSGMPGTTASFRSRAVDRAANVEPWPAAPDTSTHLYSWRVYGRVTDNRGAPVEALPVDLTPHPWNEVVTDGDGRYQAWFKQAGAHTLAITTDDPPIPATTLNLSNPPALYLPPQNSILVNGDFESELAEGWLTGGNLPIERITDGRHSGAYALSLGATECAHPCVSVRQAPSGHVSGGHSLAMNSAGELHLVWMGPALYHSRKLPNGSWAQLFTVSPDSASRPIALFDHDDTLHVFWIDSNTGLYHRQMTADGDWGDIHQLLAFSHFSPVRVPTHIAVDSRGGLHLLLQRNNNIDYLERTAEGQWRPIVKISETAYTQGAMTVGPDDALHFSWPDNALHYVYHWLYQTRQPDGRWLTPEIWGEYSSSLFVPYPFWIGIGADGRMHLLYSEYTSLKHTVILDNGLWAETTTLPHTGSFQSAGLSSDGRELHLVTMNQAYNDKAVYYQHWRQDAGWQGPQAIFEDLALTVPYRQQLLLDENDLVHILVSNYWFMRYLSTSDSPDGGYAAVTQQLFIPDDMFQPTLSFMQSRRGYAPEHLSSFTVTVDDGDTMTPLPIAVGGASWSLAWADMHAWAGQTVTITFHLEQAAGEPAQQISLDAISVGSAYPDLWVEMAGPPNALPGDMLLYEIRYGNRGKVDADDAEVTLLLPADLIFVEASPAPTIINGAIIWDVGDLLAESESKSIFVTVQAATTAVPFTTLTTSATIQTPTPEQQTRNNDSQHDLYLARFIYLPIARRQ